MIYIGLYGNKGAGKDEVAKMLHSSAQNMENVLSGSFAGAIKDEASIILDCDVDDFKDRDFKEKHRGLLIEIGESMRKIDRDFWIRKLQRNIDDISEEYPLDAVVITDVRTAAEVEFIKSRLDNLMVRVERNGYIEDEVAEDIHDDVFDFVLENNGGLEELHDNVRKFIKHYKL